MAKRKYRKGSAVERSALANVSGTVRHTPTGNASGNATLTRTERKALADKLTSADRAQYSKTMQERAQVKALTSRQAREIERQEIAEFQALNSAQSANTRGKRKHTMFAANIMASLRGDNRPEQYKAYNVSKRFVLVQSGERHTVTLLRAPAIVSFTHDNKGNVTSRDVITPVRYAVMHESPDGGVDVTDIDNARAFSELLAGSALEQDNVMQAVIVYHAFQNDLPVDAVDAANIAITSEHLKFALDVVTYGKRDALQRARLRKLRNDTRELESASNLVDLQVAHAAKLTMRNELERKALTDARQALAGSTPEGSTPEGSTPEGSTPEGSTPEGSTPEGSTPESKGKGKGKGTQA